MVDGRLTENAETATDPEAPYSRGSPGADPSPGRQSVQGSRSTLRLAAVMGREFDFQVLDRAGRLSLGRLMDVLPRRLRLA